MHWPIRIVLMAAAVYFSWMCMMAVHESGHALAALAGGGHVRRMVIPLAGFSRTDVDPNPSPRLEVWGGPILGSAIPLLGWLLIRKKLSKIPHTLIGFFTGLCLVVNGAYIGLGWSMAGGDSAELRRLGTPISLMIIFGLVAVVLGLYIWHTLGNLGDLFKDPG